MTGQPRHLVQNLRFGLQINCEVGGEGEIKKLSRFQMVEVWEWGLEAALRLTCGNARSDVT
jgi:hypothetical protein